MIKVLYRIKKPKDFRRTYQYGQKVVSPFLVMYYRTNGADNYRIGFSVSKKIGKAVVRNKIKRRLREVCRINEGKFPQGVDIIFVARSRVKEADFRVIEKDLLRMIKKIRIIADE